MSSGHGASLKDLLVGSAGTIEQQNNTLLDSFFIFNFFNICLFLTQRETETEHEWGRGRERGTQNPKRAPSPELSAHRARHGAQTHEPRDHDPSRSRTLNLLSHPGAPHTIGF